MEHIMKAVPLEETYRNLFKILSIRALYMQRDGAPIVPKTFSTDQQLILFRRPSFFLIASHNLHNTPHVSANRPSPRIWSFLQASLHSHLPRAILNCAAPVLQQRAQVLAPVLLRTT